MAGRISHFDLESFWKQFCDPWKYIFKWFDKFFDSPKFPKVRPEPMSLPHSVLEGI